MNFLYVFNRYRPALWGAFFIFTVAYLAYALVCDREYTAFAQVQGFSPNGATNPGGAKAGADDFEARVRLVESADFLRGMSDRLTEADRQQLAGPFKHWLPVGAPLSAGEILLEQRKVSPNRVAQIIDIGLTHPNPELAARMANAMADEFVHQSETLNDKHYKDTLGTMQTEVEVQNNKAAADQTRINDLLAKYGRPKLDPTSAAADLANIQSLSQKASELKSSLDQLNEARKRIAEQTLAGQPVWALSFIAQQDRIVTRIREYQTQLGRLEELRHEQYTEDSSVMLEEKGRISGLAAELAASADTIAKQITADAESVQANLQQTLTRLNDVQKQAQELGQAREEFAALVTDHAAAQKTAAAKSLALSDQQTKFKLSTTTYSILAKAEPPTHADAPHWGRFIGQALGAGLGGSLMLAVGLMIFRRPPMEEREEHERRRRRHRRLHSSTRGR